MLKPVESSYRKACSYNGFPMHRDLIAHFITVQAVVLSPICSHIAEHFWTLLGREGSVVDAGWPKVGGGLLSAFYTSLSSSAPRG